MTHCTTCNDKGYFTLGKWPHQYNCTCSIPRGTSYAGIGSPVTPVTVTRQMEMIASMLAVRGFALRSGKTPRAVPSVPDTDSADLAFERGCDAVTGRKTIRVRGLMPHTQASQIIAGDKGDDLVRFVVTWDNNIDELPKALEIALLDHVPVFNLAAPGTEQQLWAWLAQ